MFTRGCSIRFIASSPPRAPRLRVKLAYGLAASFCVLFGVAIASQAAPSITSVAPRGLQIGRPTTLVITGSDLSADIQLISEAKIAGQKVKPAAKADRLEVEVTLDPTTPPGLYA